jgi:serine/threonine-protein kinase
LKAAMAESSTAHAAMTGPKSQPDPLVGQIINDRFKILSVIARGGMGRVYRAEQAPLGRVCAVKVLQPNYTGDSDPEFYKRFFLEASVVSKLKHPNTITVYDYGQTADGVYFMAMEYLEGRTLHRLIRDEGPLDPGRALRILVQVARSLREAHGQGVIHRDLKPANIYLITHDEDPDFVKVLDFGLVKNVDENDGEGLTKTGLFMGSPKYMAPEQIRGMRVTPATDVYALGVILYEMITGKAPFEDPNSANLLLAHVHEPVPAMATANPLVSVPVPIEEIVLRCMAKNPEERFQSMDELIAAIKHSGLFGPHNSMTGEFSASLLPPRPGEPSRLGAQSFLPDPVISVSGGYSLANMSAPRAVMQSSLPPPLPVVEAKPAGNRMMLVSVGLVALALVAAAVIVTTLGRQPETVAPRTRPPVTTETVTLVLESDPSGAEIVENGQVIGRTPMRDTWTGENGNPNRHHTFTFRKPGHADAIVTLTGGTIVHLARLQPIQQQIVPSVVPAVVEDAGTQAGGRVPGRNPGGRNPGGRTPGGGTPNGYRNNVY